MWAYALLWALTSPLWLLALLLHPRLRGHRAERLGRPAPVEPGVLWVHAASVGEGRVAEALFAALRRLPGRPVLLRTATSDTGLAAARGHDALCALPLDRPATMRRWVARLRPRALVLVESELWPGLLAACEACGVPVIVLNARPGRGTERLRARFPALWRPQAVVAWLAVSATAAAGLRRWGLRPVDVLGDLKRDAPRPAAALAFSRPYLLAGSTRDGDEAALLDARPADLQLVLAPRHPERFPAVARLLDASGLPWVRRSALRSEVPAEPEVVLLDSVGELGGLYGGATLAFVGGTFDASIGGHSPAEALAAGVPVVHGPEIRANEAAFDPARCVRAASVSDLPEAIAAATALGRADTTSDGAADRAAARVMALALAQPPPERPYRPELAGFAALWRARPRRFATGPNPIPVIAVGNLVSGGSGKTQVVRHLLGRLREHRPLVVARGYGREKGPLLRDGSVRADAAWLGDESAMLHGEGWAVLSCPDRALAVAEAARRGAGVVLLDDGLQQGQVKADLVIAVVDARHPMAGGVIPMGEAREGPEALQRADLVWLFGDEEPEVLRPHRRGPLVRAEAVPRGWVGPEPRPLEAFAGQRVVAFAAIAQPGRFLEALVRLGVEVAQWRAFPDHHRFTDEERAALQAPGLPLLTTEKDRARLPPDFPAYALVLDMALQRGEDALATALQGVFR